MKTKTANPLKASAWGAFNNYVRATGEYRKPLRFLTWVEGRGVEESCVIFNELFHRS